MVVVAFLAKPLFLLTGDLLGLEILVLAVLYIFEVLPADIRPALVILGLPVMLLASGIFRVSASSFGCLWLMTTFCIY